MTTDVQEPRPRGKFLAPWIAAGIAAVAAVTAVLASDPGSPSSQTLGDLALLASSLTATVSCARAAARGGRNARAWRWIAVATLVWSSGMVVWTFYGVTRGHDYPFPSPADAAFIGYALPAVVGLLSFPRLRASSVALVRTLLDAAVIASAVLFISWATVLGPLHDIESEHSLGRLTALAYPAVDVLVASVVLVLTMRQPPGQRLPWLCLAGGFLLLAVTDSIFVRLAVDEVAGTTGTPLVSGWMCAFLLIALGAAVPRTTRSRTDRQVYAVAVELLPYVPVLGAALVAGSSLVSEQNPFLLLTGLVLLLLVTVRQVLIVLDNVALTRDLEQKVVSRTAELKGLAAIVSSSEDAIIGKTTDGIVTSWNPGAQRVYGYTAEEAVGRHVRFLLLGGDLESEEAHMAAVREDGQRRSFETHRVRSDGSLVPVAMTMFPVRGDHGVEGIATISQDITERRRTEAELLAAREAALESSRLKSEFLATMSHEIRTPMNGVVGLTALLLQTPLDEVQRQYAEGVKNAGEALLALLNDILDLSKLEAGKVELEPAPFDPRRLVDEVVGLLAEQGHGKGLELIAHCDPAVPARLVGDSRAVRQILLNLVSNAVKFTSAGEVAVLAVVEDRAGNSTTLRFEVRDTGVGIAPEHQELVFDSFAQADASTTRGYGGTGLGLAICRRLVEALGGRIGVDSVPGEGSVFWFTVPLSPAAPDEPGRVPAPRGLPAGLRVLVVDDNATTRLVLESQLRAWGLRTRTAPGAREALDVLRCATAESDPFDIAVLDMCMPGTDGLDLARAINDDDSLTGTAVVLLTSAGLPDRTELSAAGVREWLSKPVRSSELHDRLTHLFAGAPEALCPTAGAPPEQAGAVTKGRLLVVEDNAVNQLVARTMAEKLGYDVEVVEDGAQAVATTAESDYAAVLMDCHMPVMDGFAATRAIRERAGRDGTLPIIAMTAGAMAEDRRRCLAAGMDDYIAKPVDMAELEAVLGRWARAPEESAGPPAVSGQPAPVLDPERLDLLRALGPGVLEATARAFQQEARSGLQALRQACPEGGTPLQRAAHQLKGSAANIGATRAARLCQEIEDRGRGAAPPEPHLLAQLETELARVQDSLDHILSSTT